MFIFHFYRHSLPFSRLIYKGGETPHFDGAEVDYSEFKQIEGKNGERLRAVEEYEQGKAYLNKDVFTDLDEELQTALGEIEKLDHDPGTDSPFEKELRADLEAKFAEEIALLEHNYSKVAVEALGNSDERLTQVQALLTSEFQEFSYQLIMEVYREAIHQDKVKEATDEDKEAARAAKIMLINDAVGIDVGDYILDTNSESVINEVFKNPLPENAKEFNRRLQDALGEEELENAAEAMLKEIDSRQTEAEIKANKQYFQQAIDESIANSGGDPEKAINFEIGEDETERLVNVLAKRFKVIERDGKTYVVDMLPSTTIKKRGRIKVKNDKDFEVYDAEQFKTSGKLKEICDTEFRTTKDLRRQEKAMKRRNKKDRKMERELLENIFRGKWSRLDEIRGLKQLKKRVGKNKGKFKNKTWKQVAEDVNELNEEMDSLAPENTEDAPENTNPLSEQFRQKHAENYANNPEQWAWLVDFVEFLGEMMSDETGKHSDDEKEKAKEQYEDLDAGAERRENVQAQMRLAKDFYANRLENFNENGASLLDLGRLNSGKINPFDLSIQNSGDDEEMLKAAQNYDSFKEDFQQQAIEEYFLNSLDLGEGWSLERLDDDHTTLKKDDIELELEGYPGDKSNPEEFKQQYRFTRINAEGEKEIVFIPSDLSSGEVPTFEDLGKALEGALAAEANEKNKEK